MTFLLASLIACTRGADDRVNPDDTSLINGGDPYIELLSPLEGETVCGAPVHVEVKVANIVLVPPGDPEDAEPGTGHVDISMNGQPAGMVWVEETDLSDVADGAWQLKVQLSYADHTAVEPYAGDLAYITVSAAVCP